LDIAKAFDSVSHESLIALIEHIGFPPRFLNLVKAIYNTDGQKGKANKARFIINGKLTTEDVTVSSGTRQGCPLSPLLYILVAELFNQAVIKDPEFKGHVVGNFTKKVSSYADDTAVHISTKRDLEILMDRINDFEEATGLKVNLGKSKIVPIGTWRNRKDSSSKAMIPFDVPFECRGETKYLGAPVGPVRNLDKWWVDVISKVKSQIPMWSMKSSSVYDRSLIIKTMLLSKVWYLASVIPMPEEVADELEKICLSYLWGNTTDSGSGKVKDKLHKIAKSQIRKSKAEGGLDFWHVNSKAKALKSEWVIRVIRNPLGDLSKVIRGVTQNEIERSGTDINPFASFLIQDTKDMKCKTLESLQRAWSKIVIRREESHVGDVLVVLDMDEAICDRITVETQTETEILGRNSAGRTTRVHRHMALREGTKGSIHSSWLGWENIKYYVFEEEYNNIKKVAEHEQIFERGYKKGFVTHNKKLYEAQLHREVEKFPQPKDIKWVQSDQIVMKEAFKTIKLSIASSSAKSHHYLILNHAVPVNDRVHRAQLPASDTRKCTFCKKSNETIRHLYYECKESLLIKKQAWETLQERRNINLHADLSPGRDFDPRRQGGDNSGNHRTIELTFRQIANWHLWKTRCQLHFQGRKLNRDMTAKAIVLEFELTIRAKIQELRSRLRSSNLRDPKPEGEENQVNKNLRNEITALNHLLEERGDYDAEILDCNDFWAQENEAEYVQTESLWTEIALSLSKRQRQRRRNKRLKDLLDKDKQEVRRRRSTALLDAEFVANTIQEELLQDNPDQPPMPVQIPGRL
jgi:hypothetical protein